MGACIRKQKIRRVSVDQFMQICICIYANGSEHGHWAVS